MIGLAVINQYKKSIKTHDKIVNLIKDVKTMSLDFHHQMSVIMDILSNQQLDCCGTVAECEQLERLVKSLLANDNITTEAKNVLMDVYEYSQHGKYHQNLDEHIQHHQQDLSQWIEDIHQLS
jgi:archaellum component FlaC